MCHRTQLLVCAENLNTISHACAVNTLNTEPSSQAFRYLVLTENVNTSELSFNTEIIGSVSIFFWRKGPRAELLSLESISWN